MGKATEQIFQFSLLRFYVYEEKDIPVFANFQFSLLRFRGRPL